jgi:hypothetical protein
MDRDRRHRTPGYQPSRRSTPNTSASHGSPPGIWDERIHMTDFLRATLHDGQRVAAAVVNAGWLEVDTPASDLALYEDIVRGSKLRGWMTWPPASPRSV